MKFLLDENISRRIIPLIKASFHEVDYLLSPATKLQLPVSDHAVWKFAKENNYHIITRDEDFIKLSLLFGSPPKVVYLNIGNTTTQKQADILNQNAMKIKEFISLEEYGFLAING